MGKDDLRNAKYVIDIGPVPSIPVEGSDMRFPVGRIYCVGRNYAEHAKEMGHDPNREPPFFFMKAANSIVQNGSEVGYPVGTKDVHHEIEMVVALGKGGKNIPVEKALEHVWGYGVGLDMTRRDIQGEAKKMGRPWEMGKSFQAPFPAMLRKIVLPSALPAMMAGARLALGQAVSGMVVAELTLVGFGIGSAIEHAETTFRTADLIAIVLVVMAEGVLLSWGARLLQQRLERWRVGEHGIA